MSIQLKCKWFQILYIWTIKHITNSGFHKQTKKESKRKKHVLSIFQQLWTNYSNYRRTLIFHDVTFFFNQESQSYRIQRLKRSSGLARGSATSQKHLQGQALDLCITWLFPENNNKRQAVSNKKIMRKLLKNQAEQLVTHFIQSVMYSGSICRKNDPLG